MMRRRGAKKHHAGNGAEKSCGINPFLEIMNFFEALVKGQNYQESGEHLCALQQYSQFLQHVVQASFFGSLAIACLRSGIFILYFFHFAMRVSLPYFMIYAEGNFIDADLNTKLFLTKLAIKVAQRSAQSFFNDRMIERHFEHLLNRHSAL